MNTSYPEITPLWDLSQATNFSQLPDDDFLALLQKQFPSSNVGNDSVNPQNVNKFPVPTPTPPSEDSSPSPTATRSQQDDEDFGGDLKRKASDDDLEEGPSHKNQNTSSSKKGSSSKRKSSGAGEGPDQSRLLKRKEQNRAAQRAFRERKEKHVKDLEDKVAALEAKNDLASSENENLRDLLKRLQSENTALKQTSFTFSVPKPTSSTSPSASSANSPPGVGMSNQPGMFSLAGPSHIPASAYSSFQDTLTNPQITNPLDLSSLTSFDPNVLNLLDEPMEQTATDGASQLDMDFGFGNTNGGHFSSNFTTIASNPMFFSLASLFDTAGPVNYTPTPPTSTNSNHTSPPTDSTSPFNFDMNSLTAWPTPSSASQDSGTLEDLFGGYLGASQSPMDMSFMGTPSLSPIVHQASPNFNSTNSFTNFTNGASPDNSSSSSSSPESDPSLFTPVDHPSSSSETDLPAMVEHSNETCPKTKGDFVKRMVTEGASPFAPMGALLQKKSTGGGNPSVSCLGSSSFPATEQSDKNIEVLSAWRNITSTYKDVDINDLCSEFSSKARCDGMKVVLEPEGVHNIMETLSSKR